MDEHNALATFQGKNIRRTWHDNEWYFSAVDVVGALAESEDARNYWKVLKHRLNEEGSEVVTKCNQLKLLAEDGKLRETDCANTETLFRLIQSIPSPNVRGQRAGGQAGGRAPSGVARARRAHPDFASDLHLIHQN